MLCSAQKGWRRFLLQLKFCSSRHQVSRKKKISTPSRFLFTSYSLEQLLHFCVCIAQSEQIM